MKKALGIAVTVMAMNAAAEIYRCDEGGKTVYQNWPCRTKPPSEKTETTPDHAKAFECGLFESGQKMLTGKNQNRDCNKEAGFKNLKPR